MHIPPLDSPNHQATVHGLAVAGFIALVIAGISLAIYSARFVPGVVGRIGTAAVYLGSVFTPAPTLSVVQSPSASTTISFGQFASATSASANTAPVSSSTRQKTTSTTAGSKTDSTFVLGGATSVAAPFGLPDLVVSISATGYLTSTSTDSFVTGSVVSVGNRPAVKFTIKNSGTNATGPWRFGASIPTVGFYVYRSQPQQSLNPGDSIDYILGFDQANRGPGQMISVTANFDRAVPESNENNNSISATFTVL